MHILVIHMDFSICRLRHWLPQDFATLLSSQCKVFSADPDVRLARRIRRDTVEKGRDIRTVLDQVRNCLLSSI